MPDDLDKVATTQHTEVNINEVEKRIGELVASINKDMSPNTVTNTIADHTKAIISRTTAESRSSLHDLFKALQDMDTRLRENDARLRAEIDKHVGFTVTTRQATESVVAQLSAWDQLTK